MTTTETAAAPISAKTDKNAQQSAKEERDDFLKFLVKLAIFVLVVRSFIALPYSIPSESMQPRLLIGDFLVVNKMSYGYSRHSLPFSAPLIPGRILSELPERGDVAVFKAPPGNNQDYIKRVIGLPGDRVQVTDGRLFLNGQPVQREPLADALVPVTDNMREAAIINGVPSACYRSTFEDIGANGDEICKYTRFRETLPNGKSYEIFDLIDQPEADDTDIFVVPDGHLFMMGDNRDNSLDSRFAATEGKGIGYVPVENLVGKAGFTVFSIDGSATLNPLTWFSAVRWDRIGEAF